MKPIKIFGKQIIDDKTVAQLQNCLVEDSIGVLTADAHYGYSMPVGGCIGYKGLISPSGVGYDIACGNKAVQTNIRLEDIDIKKVMDEIARRISFGTGLINNEKVDHEIVQKIHRAEYRPQAKLIDTARTQLGTVGSGNHFVDIFVDNEQYIWIGVHFGSRGFGHKTAIGFLALSQGLKFNEKPKATSNDAKPILFDLNSQIGQDYWQAMSLAGEYAYAGRDVVVNKVLEILDNPKVVFEVHNHHNFAWMEEHFGEMYCVVRKGCTPAAPGQYGFIGANMRDQSVIIQGVDSQASKDGLYSTVHGAGRIMSRTQAAGKTKWIRNEQGHKRLVTVGKGLIDFDEVLADMKANNIELRGAGADEAPGAYKKLTEVLQYQGMDFSQKKDQTIDVIHVLTPIGVAMAGNEFDPYKD
jgi:tRNA-splicing ligase RtcB